MTDREQEAHRALATLLGLTKANAIESLILAIVEAKGGKAESPPGHCERCGTELPVDYDEHGYKKLGACHRCKPEPGKAPTPIVEGSFTRQAVYPHDFRRSTTPQAGSEGEEGDYGRRF